MSPDPFRLIREMRDLFDYVEALEHHNRLMRAEIVSLRSGEGPLSLLDDEGQALALPSPPKPREPLREVRATPPRQVPGGKAHGFEGDVCDNCQAMMMVRNGSCLKCTSCGTTTGCS